MHQAAEGTDVRPQDVGALQAEDGRQRPLSGVGDPLPPLSSGDNAPEPAEARQRRARRRANETPDQREHRLKLMRDWAAQHRDPPAPGMSRRTVARRAAAEAAVASTPANRWTSRDSKEGSSAADVAWQRQELGVQAVIERAILENSLGAGSPWHGLTLAEFHAEYQPAVDERHKWRQPTAKGGAS